MPLTVASGLTDQGKQDAPRKCARLSCLVFLFRGIARGRECRSLRAPFRERIRRRARLERSVRRNCERVSLMKMHNAEDTPVTSNRASFRLRSSVGTSDQTIDAGVAEFSRLAARRRA